MKKKVYVGMSGGVDSSVSAALLKKDGYDVTGVFIKVWQPDWITCNWKEERLEAMRAAAQVNISFVTLDLVNEYKMGVIDYMISEYRAGRTPNPDVMCNREVKFGAFWKWAKKNGADFIATGHYARIIKVNGINHLHKGLDENKDQSYFLWTLNQADLSHVLFPIGYLLKPDVRKLAQKFNLPNADKKDSQGLCFIGKVDVKRFLSHYIEQKPGDVIDESGAVIGTHPSSTLFTIGERHGFTITKKSPNDAALFVVGKNMKNNTITVANKLENELSPYSKMVASISNVNWVSVEPKNSDPVEVRSRYRETLSLAKVSFGEDVSVSGDENESNVRAEFESAQRTLTPGQSLVIYRGTECLGGGIIV